MAVYTAVIVADRRVYVDTQGTQTVKICTLKNTRGVYEQYYRLRDPYVLEHNEMVSIVGRFATIDDVASWLMSDRKAKREPQNETTGSLVERPKVPPNVPPVRTILQAKPAPPAATQICTNGHLATVEATFCEKCGETTIAECPKCNTKIRITSTPPSFCYRCGSPFPWTESKKQAAVALFLEETQDRDARREFGESVTQIIKDTPQAEVASRRINRLLGKISIGAATAIRDILVNVASEAAKKILMPGG